MISPIKILIADDHDCAASGLQNLLNADASIEVTGIAKNRKEILALAEETDPLIIITEIDFLVAEGSEAIEKLIKKLPGIYFIAYSGCRQVYIIDRFIKSGLRGFVSKTSPADQILWAVKTVATGDFYFCTETLARLEDFEINGPKFTKGQFAILPYICEGKCDKEIAMLSNLSPRTIESHRTNMKQRLGVTTTAGIITYAVKHGFLIHSFLQILLTSFWEDFFLPDMLVAVSMT